MFRLEFGKEEIGLGKWESKLTAMKKVLCSRFYILLRSTEDVSRPI